MTHRTERDTVPAPPVASSNPTAELRKSIEASDVVVRRTKSSWGGDGGGWVGMKRREAGIYEDVTPELTADAAMEWLRRARLSIREGTVFPAFCRNGHLKETYGVCATCLRGGR